MSHVTVQCLDCRERTAFPATEPISGMKCQRCGSLRWRVESHPFPMARPAVPPRHRAAVAIVPLSALIPTARGEAIAYKTLWAANIQENDALVADTIADLWRPDTDTEEEDGA